MRLHLDVIRVIINHSLVDKNLLIDSSNHDFFVHGLILAPDEVVIKRNVQIIHVLYVLERFEHV